MDFDRLDTDEIDLGDLAVGSALGDIFQYFYFSFGQAMRGAFASCSRCRTPFHRQVEQVRGAALATGGQILDDFHQFLDLGVFGHIAIGPFLHSFLYIFFFSVI